MKKLLGILVLSLLLSGCQTPYGEEGLMGGYSSVKISEKSYRVSYVGNDYIGFEKVKARAKLRAGEIAANNGLDYLTFSNSEYYRGNGITYTVKMFKFSKNLTLKKNGQVICKINSAEKNRSEAESYVREKLASCTNNEWHIVSDLPKIYGHAR